ncbi:DMT family transporter [Chitinivorax sp. B]|uniref:DMT family transporter n=1 Tax=Chitinivorax sp. B TaxID=2502235 RepID=UPI0020182005|nr:DMT family transporter [Chitinivorax sp. B]
MSSLQSKTGALWMLVAGVLFACMGVCVKIGAAYFTPAELVFYRSFVGLLVVWLIILIRGDSLRTPYWRNHVYRSLSGLGALSLYFYTIVALPLPTAVTLNYTSSLFIAPLLIWWYHERPVWGLLGAVVVGFVGVSCLLQPTFEQDKLFEGFLGLCSGFLAAIAMINVRQLGQIGEPEYRVVFYFSLISSLGAGAWMLVHRFSAITGAGALILLCMGASATLAQLALTRAYSTGATLMVASLAYSTVVFSALAGWLVWDHIPSISAWSGIVLVILSGAMATRLSVCRK